MNKLYDKTDPLIKRDTKARTRASVISVIVSMVLDVLLAAGKIVSGVIFGSISVVADGLNNISDSGSLIVSLIGIRVSSMPADREHPYGHARGEHVAALVIAIIIIFLAYNLFTSSLDAIFEKRQIDFSLIMVIVLAAGIAVKLAMFCFNLTVAKRYGSEIVRTIAIDSLGDVASSAAVLVSVIVCNYTSFGLDGYAGCLVSVIIAVSGISVLRRTISELMGKRPSREFVEELRRRLLAHEGIYGIHGLTVHSYVNKYYATVHAEIDADIPVLAAHELIDKIEKEFESTDVMLTIHLDPVILHDSELTLLSSKAEQAIAKVDPSFKLHDFRLIKCDVPQIVFELCVPLETKLPDSDIRGLVYEALYDEFGLKYQFSIDIKRELSE